MSALNFNIFKIKQKFLIQLLREVSHAARRPEGMDLWWKTGAYPMPEMSLQKRKAPYPCTKEEREAKEALMAKDMLRTLFLPSLSARPPRMKAPAIIPR